jgi:hypothetical protein
MIKKKHFEVLAKKEAFIQEDEHSYRTTAADIEAFHAYCTAPREMSRAESVLSGSITDGEGAMISLLRLSA